MKARAGILTIDEMMKLSEKDLYNIKNMGKKSVDEILNNIEKISSGLIDIYSLGTASNNAELPICDDDYLVAHVHNVKGLKPANVLFTDDGLMIDDLSLEEMGFKHIR